MRRLVEIIKSKLSETLTEADKVQQINQILETNHPSIIENRKCYQLTSLEDSILSVLENS